MGDGQKTKAVKGNRVLVVDDEEGMRQMLTVMLGKHGFDVREAKQGVEALQRLK